jgi:hypothetical protein
VEWLIRILSLRTHLVLESEQQIAQHGVCHLLVNRLPLQTFLRLRSLIGEVVAQPTDELARIELVSSKEI